MLSTKICLCGLMGAGKTTAAHFLASKLSLPVFSTGGILRAYCKRRGIPIIREELQRQSAMIVESHGQYGAMDWFIANSTGIDWQGDMIFEGFRHPDTFARFKELYPSAILINCICNINTRIERIAERDDLSLSEVLRVISNPVTEQDLEGFELMAHIHKDELMDPRLLLSTVKNILSLLQ